MKDEAYREALRHLSPELIGETVASGIDIRLFIEVGIDAGYEAAVAAERERIVAELETQIQIASYGGSSYRETARMVLEKAIEMVKGDKK